MWGGEKGVRDDENAFCEDELFFFSFFFYLFISCRKISSGLLLGQGKELKNQLAKRYQKNDYALKAVR